MVFLIKTGIVISRTWETKDFKIVTDNEALVIEAELVNGETWILATIYCPDGNPNIKLFRKIHSLSNKVIFLGDFNAKHKSFGCAQPNSSGPVLVQITKELKLLYLNSTEHTYLDSRSKGTSDILDMIFISRSLSSHNISFSVGDDLGSDHLPVQILIDKSFKRNVKQDKPRYKVDKTDKDLYVRELTRLLDDPDFGFNDIRTPKTLTNTPKPLFPSS